MDEQIVARSGEWTLIRDAQGIVLEGKTEHRRIFSGEVSEVRAALDESFSLCVVFLSAGGLYFADAKGAVACLAPKPASGAVWMQPLVAQASGIVAVSLLRDGKKTYAVAFQRREDGSFRGRRLMEAEGDIRLEGLYAQPVGAALFLRRTEAGTARITVGDPTAQAFRETAVFSLPEPLEELQFAYAGGQRHSACLSRGTLFADGVPIASGMQTLCLATDEKGLSLCALRMGQLEMFRLRDGRWVKEGSRPAGGEQRVLHLNPNGNAYVWEVLPTQPAAMNMGEEYRTLLSNQALLLRTLREKQELQQRTLFALQAKTEAQAAQIENLRRRCEGLYAALEALETVYRGTTV